MDGLYGTGLETEEWHLLREAILCAAYRKGPSAYENLPDNLKQHEIGRLIYKHLYEHDKSALNKAAEKMVTDPSTAWLALMKS